MDMDMIVKLKIKAKAPADLNVIIGLKEIIAMRLEDIIDIRHTDVEIELQGDSINGKL